MRLRSLLLCIWSLLACQNAIAKENLFVDARAIGLRANHFVSPSGKDTNPGTEELPWATINHAAETAIAGDTVAIRGGRYLLASQVRVHSSGRPDAWISFVGIPGEKVVLDAQDIGSGPIVKGRLNEGAFQVQGVSYVRVANLTIINSHDAGITVRDASDIEIINNTTVGTFSSGIAVWDTNHDDKGTKRIRIVGNTISRATTWDLAPPNADRIGEPPHEALSIGGAIDFEVAYNHVLDSDKEGITIKETSKRGRVHHNLVEGMARQGIYVGSYFGRLADIEVFSNVIDHCHGAGFAISVEQGEPTERVNFHNNLVFNNDGSGVYFSRWGVENVRRDISISHNIFYHNGYGKPGPGQAYPWWTGGVYLYSANVEGITIKDNIFSENHGFQVGYSELFLKNRRSWQAAARAQRIVISHNLFFTIEKVTFPIESGGAPFDRLKIYETNGVHPVFGDPSFTDIAHGNFVARANSVARRARISAGPIPPRGYLQTWWKKCLQGISMKVDARRATQAK